LEPIKPAPPVTNILMHLHYTGSTKSISFEKYLTS
jgi:hypothetical protein